MFKFESKNFGKRIRKDEGKQMNGRYHIIYGG